MASATDFPHVDAEGAETSTKILLHRRRVPPGALTGEAPVNVCNDCRTALWAKRPSLPKMADRYPERYGVRAGTICTDPCSPLVTRNLATATRPSGWTGRKVCVQG